MATPSLDVGLIGYFLPIISFLFVFTIVYAIFEKSKILGENTGLHALVAFIVATFVALTPGIRNMINFMIPWFLLMFFFIIFVVVIFMFLGVSADTMKDVMSGSTVVSLIIATSVIILIVAFSGVYGESIKKITTEESNETASESLGATVGKVLFNTKILGAVLVLLIASQVIRLIALPVKG